MRSNNANEERYNEISQIFLKMFGLWTYNQSYLALIQKLLLTSIFFTFITVQLV